MGANRMFKKSPSEPDMPVYQRPRAYYDGDERIRLTDGESARRVFREFTKPYPIIARENGKPMDRGGRMPDEWWANEFSK